MSKKATIKNCENNKYKHQYGSLSVHKRNNLEEQLIVEVSKISVSW